MEQANCSGCAADPLIGIVKLASPKNGVGIMVRLVRLLLTGSAIYFLAACAALAPPEPDLSRIAEPRQAAQQRLLVTVPLADNTRLAYLSRVLSWDYDLQQIGHWPLESLGIYCFVFHVSGGQIVSGVMGRLRSDPRVESVQPLQLYEVMAKKYNDPYLKLQHGFHEMQVAHAHTWSTGKSVHVAVIDTGIDVDHPDLRDRIDVVQNFVGGVNEWVYAESHGTAVAGVIGARGNNDLGVVGIAPDTKLIAIRACWQESKRDGGLCSSFTLAQALNFAIAKKARVINLSLEGPYDPLLDRLVTIAIDQGIAVAMAVPERDRPAQLCSSIADVIRVDASDGSSGNTERPYPRAMAPGVDIITTAPQGRFDFYSGSSLATAHVSGLLALLLERAPELTVAEMQNLLMLNNQSTGLAGAGVGIAPVRVNACTTLAKLVSSIAPRSMTGNQCPE